MLALGQTTAPAAATGPEQELWSLIERLQAPAPATEPYGQWFETTRTRKAALLEQLRLYQTLYPGGVHRDKVIALELATLFENATLAGGDLRPLRERIAALLDRPPSRAAAQEAAYWRVVCGAEPAPPAQRPALSDLHARAAGRIAAWTDYLRQYPDSRHTPRVAMGVFDAALERGDPATMDWVLETLQQHFASHPTTGILAGVRRAREQIGRTFEPDLRDLDDRPIDWASFRGRPVLLVVWSADDAAARAGALRVERFRSEHAELAVVGLSLDVPATRTRAASEHLGLPWRHCNDGRGGSGPFVGDWGIRRLPTVFVLDRAGTLIGVETGDGWMPLALLAVRGEPPPAPSEN